MIFFISIFSASLLSVICHLVVQMQQNPLIEKNFRFFWVKNHFYKMSETLNFLRDIPLCNSATGQSILSHVNLGYSVKNVHLPYEILSLRIFACFGLLVCSFFVADNCWCFFGCYFQINETK